MSRFGLVIAILVVVVDQASKIVVLNALGPFQSVSVSSFFNLVLVLNTGISFGLFASGDTIARWFLIAVALSISVLLMRWLANSSDRLVCAGLGMIIGGAVGNVIDRLVHKAVVDFLDFHFYGWHWPAFNIADSAITIGVVLFVLASFFERRGRSKLDVK
ncbi:MAG: Lipoprotein signal peptidase [Alphaproteobacteria bacterium MarineAlpha9_Bin7]|nr:MAG: Lipoprotein signal peptidase [Alphaproteobacteria bacterium MarineAlpha9_Bin7]